MSTVGKLIRLTRQVQGNTLSELATVIGRSEAHLQQIEEGFLSGTPATLFALAQQLNISADVMRDAYVRDAAYTARILWERGESVKTTVKHKGEKVTTK